MGSPRFFGFVIGGDAAGGARGRLDGDGLGPERRARRADARRRGRSRRSPAPGCSTCSGLPRGRLVRARHRLPDGPRHRARRRPPRACSPTPAGTSSATGLAGAPRGARGRGRGAPHHGRPRAAAARARRRPAWSRSRSTSAGAMRPDALAEALAAGDGPGDRLRPGGQREHRRGRPARRDLPTLAPGRRRLGARGRRVRPVGRGEPAPAGARGRRSSAPTRGPPTRTSGSTCPTTAGSPFVADREAHRAAMAVHGELPAGGGEGGLRDPIDWTPEFSRRARGFAVYAALRSLGRDGRGRARRPAVRLRGRGSPSTSPPSRASRSLAHGLNQVLVRFGADDAATDAAIAARPARRHVLHGRHDLARAALHAALRSQLADDGRGRGSLHGRHPQGARLAAEGVGLAAAAGRRRSSRAASRA